MSFERKDINPELLARENEVKEAVEINRFFADRKASKEISIDDVMAAVDASVGKNENGVRVLKNTVTGETATLSNNSISKMFSTTSQHASDNIGGILGKEAIANIGSIFDTAILVKTTPDAKHGTKNRILRYANVIRSDGENFIVKMTVKEMANKRPELTDIEIEDNGERDLSAYDMKVGRKNTAGNSLGSFAAGANATVAHNSGTDITINDLIDFVNIYSEDSIQIDGKSRAARNSLGRRIARTEEGLRAFYEWFGDSKVVDENGKPLVVYHSTDADFDTFDKSKRKRGYFGEGFYFSNDKDVSEHYGKNVMEVYLSIKKPIEGVSPKELRESLEKYKQQGYDGVIQKYKDGTATYAVFEPNQIKSVYNRGTFSSESDNIYYQTVIIDIYNAVKNRKTAEDYYRSYGADQINRLISMLSAEDRAFGDMLMEDVNSRFKELNEVYVRVYGMDLKKVDDYWMGSTEHVKLTDIRNDFAMQSTTPGFFKERTAGAVVPIAKNAWIKYQKHIAQSYYMTEIAEKYKNLADIFKSNRIENRIKNHFGEGVYNTLKQQIDNLGLNVQSSQLDDVSGYFQKLLNGWVGAKISVNPIVFVGQLTSFTNYAEGISTGSFLKNIDYATFVASCQGVLFAKLYNFCNFYESFLCTFCATLRTFCV